jgi:formyl-CoA transferase
MAGLYEPIRRPGEPPPVVVAGALGDNASALYALIGTLAALRQRERTGRGQHVDIAMFDAMIAMTDMVPFMWSIGEPPIAATAGRTGIVAAFAARDGHFVIAIFAITSSSGLRAGRAAGLVRDPRFATREGWAAHRESVVRPAVEAWARDKTKLEASRLLAEEGIPAGPSNLAPDLCGDPHVAARDMLIEVPRADGGDPMLVCGNPVKLSAAPEGPLAPMPGLGEHTEAVLREALALGDAELAALRREGVISQASRSEPQASEVHEEGP